MGKTSNKGPVKVAKPQEGANIFDFGGDRPIFDTRNFCGVHACHPLFKDYPQVIDRRGMERALFGLEIKVVVLRDHEDIFNSRYVIREGSGRSDGDIVHINSNGSPPNGVFCDDIFVDLIHHRLEGCWRVAEAKEHDCGLKESIACFEGRFMFVAFFDTHIVVSPSYIEL